MNIKTDVIHGTCAALEAVLNTVSSEAVSQKVVADGFHALFSMVPEEMAEEDCFDPAAAAEITRDLNHARRIINALNSFLSGKLS